jgi:L-fuconolactonase
MPNRVIDAHQHFWDRTTGDYSWMGGEAMLPLRRNFGPHDLLPLIARNGVDAAIIVQCRHDFAESCDFLAIADTHDFVVGVIGTFGARFRDWFRQPAISANAVRSRSQTQ